MLAHLLARPAMKWVRYLETTIGPDNHASRRTFAALGEALGALARNVRCLTLRCSAAPPTRTSVCCATARSTFHRVDPVPGRRLYVHGAAGRRNGHPAQYRFPLGHGPGNQGRLAGWAMDSFKDEAREEA